MEIIKKMVAKQNDNAGSPGVSIAFLGDSVTQGCFEIYRKSEESIETVFDKNSAYHNYLARIFAVLMPSVPVNIINAGISGGSAPHGLARLERDVLSYNPDMVVVCFGLNDSGAGDAGIDKYISALSDIFDRVRESGAELIFMTPNMMCTKVSCHITDDMCKSIAQNVVQTQNEGVLDKYIDAAKKLCATKNVKVCDCYSKWKAMAEYCVDVTELLANKINHPNRDMNMLFAYSLVETMFS